MTQLVIPIATAALCSLVAYGLGGSGGLEGAVLGALMGLLLCGLSYALLALAGRAQGKGVVAAMVGGALASMVLLVVFILAVTRLKGELVLPAALTALVTYLASKLSLAASIFLKSATLRADSHRC